MSVAYDAAFAPNLDLVVQHGGVAVNHYLTGSYASTSCQPAAAHAANLGSILTYEEGASELVGASRNDGQVVGRKILSALQGQGVPLDGTVAVYPSVDIEVAAGAVGACDQAFLGIRDVLAGKVSIRCYGEGALIDHLAAMHLTDGPGWLSGSTSFPGYQPDDVNVCLVQTAGDIPGTDKNLVTNIAALGAWWPAGSQYSEDPFMADLTPSQLAQISAAVWNYNLHDVDPQGNPAGGQYPAWQIVAHAGRQVAALASATPGSPVDVNDLASKLAAALGPQIAGQLGQALVKGSQPAP